MKLGELLKFNGELSSSAQVACKLNHLIRTSPFLEDIVAAVRNDPALTARILQVSNLVVFRGKNEICSVDDAVRRIGMQSVMSWVWQLSIGPTMRNSLPVYGMKAETFWRHSVVTAIAAEELHRLTSQVAEDKSTAFTAGLLHDVGKVLVNSALEAKPKALSNYCAQERLPLRAAEKQLCGYDHARLGGELLCFWGLPKSLGEAVASHHHPEADTESNLGCLLHVADLCSHSLGESHGSQASRVPMSPVAFERLQITPDAIEHVMVDIQKRFDEVETFVSVQT